MADFSSGTRLAQIRYEAARLFVEKGVAATSMSDIADAVGITKAGLYHFVPSKDELLQSLIDWAYDIYDRDVDLPARDISDPLERLHFIVFNHLYNVGRHRTETGNRVTVVLDDPAVLTPTLRVAVLRRKRKYYTLLRDTLAALKARGQLYDIDPAVATFSILGMVLWLARWHNSGGRIPLDQIVSQMTATALRGVVRHDVLEETLILRKSAHPPASATPSPVTSKREKAPPSAKSGKLRASGTRRLVSRRTRTKA